LISPGQVVTLLELLRVYGRNYVRLINCTSLIAAALQVKDDPKLVPRDMVIAALGQFDGIKPQLVASGLTNTVAQMERAESIWNSCHNCSLFGLQCVEILHRLEDELAAKVLLMIPAAVQPLYETPRVGWEHCISRFPILDNVDEMNKCFAFGRYTASVFHSLLIAEAGLIELGRHIGVTDGKLGWDATSKKLESIVKAGRSDYSLAIPFNGLEQINQCVQSMKMAWRNKVSHEANRLMIMVPDFSEPIAQEVIYATRSLMSRLAIEIPRIGQR
jgi:hypothetical protein